MFTLLRIRYHKQHSVIKFTTKYDSGYVNMVKTIMTALSIESIYWNKVPCNIRQSDKILSFKTNLTNCLWTADLDWPD